jgi:hypothetical protein
MIFQTTAATTSTTRSRAMEPIAGRTNARITIAWRGRVVFLIAPQFR